MSSNNPTSSSASDEELSANIKHIFNQINLYLGTFIFFFGIIGNILNILILSQRSLRSNTCVIIFIASSISGIIAILSGLIPRVLSYWDLDISEDVRWLCKCRTFFLFTFRSITYWLIMLATIDRWIVSSTNARLRNFNSVKNVLRSICFIIWFSIIIHCPIFYCFEANRDDTPTKCFHKNKQCRLYGDLTFAIVTILLPLILTLVLGWMTISNIRLSQTRINPVTTVSIISHPSQVVKLHQRRRRRQQQRSKKTDNYLFLMLFIQVILFACLTFPMVVQKLYTTLTMDVNKSTLRITIDNSIYRVFLLMTFAAVGMQFYINTLSGGPIFRKALIDLLKLIFRKFMRR
jgi:hypothetical protein